MKCMESCLICDRIDLIKKEENPYAVAEMKTGYIVLADHQFYEGYTIFLAKRHVTELHELDPEERMLFLQEMSKVAEAVYRTFAPKKLNYELLGNRDAHLHWHLIPRRGTDPQPQQPIWVIDKGIRDAEANKPEIQKLMEMRATLREALGTLRI